MHFLADTLNFKREFDRVAVDGYKKLVVDEGVDFATPAKIVSDDENRTLHIVPDTDENADDGAIILTKEIGLFGYKDGAKTGFKDNYVSFISLDGEYMIIKLFKGGIALRIDDELLIPNYGVDETKMVAKTSDIEWVGATWFNSFRKYYEYPTFYFDVEHKAQIGGNKGATYHREIKDENIDLSLGQLALFIQNKAKREEERAKKEQAKALNNMFTSKISNIGKVTDDVDFDDVEEDDIDDIDDDWED